MDYCLSFFFLWTSVSFRFFFFNDTATTEIYTLSLHDALPISSKKANPRRAGTGGPTRGGTRPSHPSPRSEEHTSELQSQSNLVCRLLLEKKKKYTTLLSPRALYILQRRASHSRRTPCDTSTPH